MDIISDDLKRHEIKVEQNSSRKMMKSGGCRKDGSTRAEQATEERR
jgi:hypothetical protein